MAAPQAIQTLYKGYRFRSRLEARWAVFFDALGIRYEYEKEGYQFADGARYLPDFWLPDHGFWLEVKGKEVSDEELRKAEELSRATAAPVVIGIKEPVFGTLRTYWEEWWHGFNWCVVDGRPLVMGCLDAAPGIVDDTDLEHLGPILLRGIERSHPRILAAAYKARSARFEHGETPRV